METVRVQPSACGQCTQTDLPQQPHPVGMLRFGMQVETCFNVRHVQTPDALQPLNPN